MPDLPCYQRSSSEAIQSLTELQSTVDQVEEIVTDEQRAEERSVKHPPKVGTPHKVVSTLFIEC